MAQLKESSSKFWNLDNFDGRFKTECGHIYTLLGRFFRVHKSMMVLMTLQYVLRKIIFKSDLPLTITYGESQGFSPKVDFILFVFHCVATFTVLHVIVGFDGLFFYFIGHILSEVKMLQSAFKIVQFKDNDLVISIKHHQFVLSYIHSMNQVYSNLLLHQHVSCLFGICFGLFLLSEDGMPPDLSHMCKYIPYILSFTVQTFTFCVIGSLIISWTSEIADAIFYNGWDKSEAYGYKHEKIFAINRAQVATKLTLGGFGKLDLISFTLVRNLKFENELNHCVLHFQVVKNAYSFFTFINTIQDE
ncbi:uncharacterized protein LOC135131734 isoform X1 [Zophobas morio]|uniref:uncharacterized protein LOC135131734 isoform X1 n=1 Tax=Zophobas morio TaxID=2755281 RepID=UPI003083D2E0